MKQKFLSKWIFAGVALVLGLSACNNKNEDDLAREKGYDTYSTVSLSLPASLRADDDDYNKKDVYKGVDHIKTLSLYIIDEDKPTDQPEAHHFTEDNLHLDGATGKVTMTPFRTKSGRKTVYAVINITDPIKTALNGATNKTDFDIAYKKEYEAFSASAPIASLDNRKDVIVMTGKPVTQDIKPNVSALNAPDLNNVPIILTRAAARVSVTTTAQEKSAGVYEIKATLPDGNTRVFGEISDLKWSVAQYEKKFYLLQRDDRQSPSYSWVTNNTDYTTEAPNRYDYTHLSSDKFLGVKHIASYGIPELESVEYKYISETTHEKATVLTDPMTSGYRKGNTTYVLIKGKFTPANDMWADGQKDLLLPDGDLFYGLATQKFYSSEQAAKTAGNNDRKIVTYKKGMVFYFLWVNPNEVNMTKWSMSPVYRNNIYNVDIRSFQNIGLSGNPLNPDPDPNRPDKPDPDDPDTPKPEEPLPTEKTFMVATITITPWTWHNYSIDL